MSNTQPAQREVVTTINRDEKVIGVVWDSTRPIEDGRAVLTQAEMESITFSLKRGLAIDIR